MQLLEMVVRRKLSSNYFNTDMLWINLEATRQLGSSWPARVTSAMVTRSRGMKMLVCNHACIPLLQVKSVTISGDSAGGANQLVRLVQLLNPWGSFRWKGEWGATSDAWKRYPHVREELGYYATSDLEAGVFWMEVGDFQNHFSPRRMQN